MSPTRYYQLLNALIDKPEALAADPMLVKRLRRLRSGRQRAAFGARLAADGSMTSSRVSAAPSRPAAGRGRRAARASPRRADPRRRSPSSAAATGDDDAATPPPSVRVQPARLVAVEQPPSSTSAASNRRPRRRRRRADHRRSTARRARRSSVRRARRPAAPATASPAGPSRSRVYNNSTITGLAAQAADDLRATAGTSRGRQLLAGHDPDDHRLLPRRAPTRSRRPRTIGGDVRHARRAAVRRHRRLPRPGVIVIVTNDYQGIGGSNERQVSGSAAARVGLQGRELRRVQRRAHRGASGRPGARAVTSVASSDSRIAVSAASRISAAQSAAE